MSLVANFPFFSILLCMLAGIFTSVLKPRAARCLAFIATGLVFAMSIGTLIHVLSLTAPYPFMMGHFPAPWGNEIRIGRLEALMATGLSGVLFLSLMGGQYHLHAFVSTRKLNLYLIMVELALAATLVLIYTNDLFTAYVFIEIMTIASCALVVVRQNGHTLVAATRYMIMNLLASGMVLLGIAMLYGITGHLLMEPLGQAVKAIYQTGEYTGPLRVVIALITSGLAIKTALFPFHAWAPDTYAYAPPLSSAMLSGVVSKAYLFLLIKFFYRVIGFDIIVQQHINTVLFVLGVAGLLMGSVLAISQREIRRMVAYSSVAQIAFVYMGIGLGSELGMAAAIFQMLSHAAAKSLLFLSTYELISVSGDHKRFRYLHGAAWRNPLGGALFSVAALSMVGFPFTGGFISKLNYAIAAMPFGGWTRALVLIALALSTLLNAIYFLRTVVNIYSAPMEGMDYSAPHKVPAYAGVALLLSMALTIYLGVWSGPVMRLIESGLNMFA